MNAHSEDYTDEIPFAMHGSEKIKKYKKVVTVLKASKEILSIGVIKYDENTGKPIFPPGTTEKQKQAYYKWQEDIRKSCKRVEIVE